MIPAVTKCRNALHYLEPALSQGVDDAIVETSYAHRQIALFYHNKLKSRS